jgi:hypothetical protein
VLVLGTAFACWMSVAPDGHDGADVELTVWDDEPAAVIGGGQLRVLTLNCWGLWVVGKQRQKRIRWADTHLGS